MTDSREHLPHTIRNQVDAIADKFEVALASEDAPVLDEYLKQIDSSARAALFSEMLALTIEYANKRGELIDFSALAQQYPEFRSHIEQATHAPESDVTMHLDSGTKIPTDPGSEHEQTLISSNNLDTNRTSSPNIGETVKYFGDYELLEEIARGGMGVVYKARQTSLNRDVALKMILSGELAGEKEIQRFQLEAESAGKLDHPGIVPIYEVGAHNDQHYFSMGFVDGSSLSEQLKEKPFAPREAAELSVKTARAIQYAHSNGVIHRDLKPANILVGTDGEPRITDFGLAKRVEQTSDLTMTGQVMGTPSYMPPEQASGLVDQISERADIYSLGGILYALLTGRPPFQAASTLDTLKQVIEVDPVSPRQLNSRIPRDLETIALKALDKTPSRRYSSAEDFADDLERFLNGKPISARPVGRIERTWRLAKRRPLAASLLTLASLLGLVILIGAPLVAMRESKLRDDADQQKSDAVAARVEAQDSQKKAEIARSEAVSARDELSVQKNRSDQTLYARTISLAYQDWQKGDVLKAETLLDRTNPVHRGWEFSFVKRLCHTDELTLRGRGGAPSRVRMHADKKHLVSVSGFGSADRNFYLWNIETGTLKRKFDFAGLSISLDARLVAHLVDQTKHSMRITNVFTGETISDIAGHRQPVTYSCFSNDSKLLATVGGDQRVRIWKVATGELVTDIHEKSRKRMHQIHFSHDDSKVYWRTYEGWLQVFDVESGKEIAKHDVRNNHQMLFRCATSPDGETVAVCSNDAIDIVRLDDGKIVKTLHGHAGPVMGIEYHPTEPRLVSCASDATVRVWDTESGREVLMLRGHKTPGAFTGVQAVSYCPDGSKIISGSFDGTIKIWDAKANDDFSGDPLAVQKAAGPDAAKLVVVIPDPDQECDWLIGHAGYVWDADFSQDAKLYATASSDGRVRVYDVEKRKMIQFIGGFNYGVGAVAFHPGGKFLVMGEGGLDNSDGGTIKVIELASGESVRTIDGHTGPISCLQFNQDGSRLFSATGSQRVTHRGELFCHDFETGDSIFELANLSGVSCFDLSPNGTNFALSTYAGGIEIRDSDTGEKVSDVKMEGRKAIFRSVSLSPDSKTIAAGATNWTVSLFDVKTGNRIWQKDDHTGAAMEVNFHPDGRRIASVGLDGKLRVWDAMQGDVLLTMNEGGHELYGVQFSPDGKTMISHGQSSACWVRGVDNAYGGNLAERYWDELLVDDFERDDSIDGDSEDGDPVDHETKSDGLGANWKVVAGKWAIVDGEAKGVLAPSSWERNFYAATIIPNVYLPKEFEVEFDFRAAKPMTMEIKIHDESIKNGLGSLFIGLPNAWNQRQTGTSIIAQVEEAFAEIARSTRGFDFEADKTYRLKVVRNGKFWTSYVDGVEVLQARVSANVHAPRLHLQGSFAEKDQEFYIDNFVARAPKELADDSAAIALDHATHQRLKIPELIVDDIRTNPSISDTVRKKALKLAEKRLVKSGEQNQLIIQQFFAATLPEDKRKEWMDALPVVWENAQWKSIRESLSAALAAKPDDWQSRLHYAVVLYHLGEADEALKEFQTADESYFYLNGTNHLGRIAMEIIVADENDDADGSAAWSARLQETKRSRLVKSGPQEWIELAESKVDPHKHDPDIELILDRSFEAIERLVVEADTEATFSLYDPAANISHGRGDVPSKYEIEFEYDQWTAAERIWNAGPPFLNTTVVRDRLRVERDGEDVIVEDQFVAKFNFGFYRFRRVQRWSKNNESKQWQIIEERVNSVQSRFGDKLMPEIVDDWSALDRKVDEARRSKDKLRLVAALHAAQRNKEALEIARELTELDPESTQAWTWRFLCSYSAHNADEMKLSAKTAAELDPMIGGPVQLRTFATEAHSPKAPIDVGEGLQMRIPSFYVSGNHRDVNVPGRSLAVWYPSETSLVASFIMKETDGDVAALVKNMNEAEAIFKKQFGATTLRKQELKIAGYDGFELIVQGSGNGRGMIGDGSMVGTIQSWTAIRAGDRVYGFVMSSTPDEFNARFSEFKTVLETATIED